MAVQSFTSAMIGNVSNGSRSTMLTTGLLAVIFLASGGPVVSRAVDGIPQEPNRTQALSNEQVQLAAPRDFNIPGGSLREALIEFAKQGGVQVFFSDRSVGNLQTPGLKGRMTADQALNVLLADTKLKPNRVSTAEIVVAQAATGRANDGEISLDTITVFGERVEREIRDVISSVTIIDEEKVEQKAESDVFESLTGVPNVIYIDGSSLPSIRGQSNNSGGGGGSLGNLALTGVEPRSALIVDDFARSATWGNGANKSLFDVERVEIFRGPQSTLRGRSAISGAYVVRTKDPTFTFEAQTVQELVYNEFTKFGYRGSGVASGPLIENQLAGRIGLQYQLDHDHLGGFIPGQYTGSDPNKALELPTLTARGKLLFTPEAIPGLRIKTTGTFTKYRSNLFQNAITGPGGGGFPFKSRVHAFGNDFRVVNGKAYFGGLDAEYSPNDDNAVQVLISYSDENFITDRSLNSSQVVFNEGRDTRQTNEAVWRFGQSGDMPLSGLVGASFERRTTDYDADAFGVPSLLLLSTETDTYSIYGDFRHKFTDALEFNVGGRVLWKEQVRSLFFGAPGLGNVRVDDTVFLPKVGLLYKVNDQHTLGISLALGYLDGGRGLNFQTFQPYDFGPERVTTLEGVHRMVTEDGRFRLNTTVFHNWYTDLQAQVSLGGLNGFEVRNQPKAVSYGAEIEAQFSPIDRVDLTAALGLLHTEVTRIDPGAVNAQKGNEFGQDPDITLNFGASWLATEFLRFYGDVSYVGKYFNDVANTPGEQAGDYWIANIGAEVKFQNVTARVFVNNVTDELAFSTRFQNQSATVLRPRVIGASVTAKF